MTPPGPPDDHPAAVAGLDPKATAWRPDLAAESLADRLPAARYAPGAAHVVTAFAAPVSACPDDAAPMTSQLLLGEPFTVYEIAAGQLPRGTVSALDANDLLVAGDDQDISTRLGLEVSGEARDFRAPVDGVPVGARRGIDLDDRAVHQDEHVSVCGDRDAAEETVLGE